MWYLELGILKIMFLVVQATREKNITCAVFWWPQFVGLNVLTLILQMNINIGKRRKLNTIETIFLHAMPQNTSFNHFNPLTPMSDQGRISPHNIKQMSDENKQNYYLGNH